MPARGEAEPSCDWRERKAMKQHRRGDHRKYQRQHQFGIGIASGRQSLADHAGNGRRDDAARPDPTDQQSLLPAEFAPSVANLIASGRAMNRIANVGCRDWPV